MIKKKFRTRSHILRALRHESATLGRAIVNRLRIIREASCPTSPAIWTPDVDALYDTCERLATHHESRLLGLEARR